MGPFSDSSSSLTMAPVEYSSLTQFGEPAVFDLSSGLDGQYKQRRLQQRGNMYTSQGLGPGLGSSFNHQYYVYHYWYLLIIVLLVIVQVDKLRRSWSIAEQEEQEELTKSMQLQQLSRAGRKVSYINGNTGTSCRPVRIGQKQM